MDIKNEIIRKITRYAARISELSNSGSNFYNRSSRLSWENRRI